MQAVMRFKGRIHSSYYHLRNGILRLYRQGRVSDKLPGPTYSKLSDIRGLICEKFNFRKLGVSATEIAILKEN